jgi:hypothetical protein
VLSALNIPSSDLFRKTALEETGFTLLFCRSLNLTPAQSLRYVPTIPTLSRMSRALFFSSAVHKFPTGSFSHKSLLYVTFTDPIMTPE